MARGFASVLVCVAVLQATVLGADATALRSKGRLVAAGAAFEASGTFDGLLRASEAYLRAGCSQRALGCLERADEMTPHREVVEAWTRWLSGRPVAFPRADAQPESTPAELHLAGILCRLAGTAERERYFLEQAHAAEPANAVWAVDLWRAGGGKDAKALAKIPDCAERAVAELELAAGPGAGGVREVLARAAAQGFDDPRIEAVRARTRTDTLPRHAELAATLTECKNLPLGVVFKLSGSSATKEALLGEVERIIEPWTERTRALAEKLPSAGQSWRLQVQRGWTYLDLSTMAPDDLLLDLARPGLGACVPVLLFGLESRDGRTVLPLVSELFLRVECEYSHELLSAALRRHALSPATSTRIRWHMAGNLLLHRKSAQAVRILRELVKTRAWEACEGEEPGEKAVVIALRLAEMQLQGARLRDAQARLTTGKQVPLRAAPGKLLLLDFFSSHCGPCHNGLRKIVDWRKKHGEAPACLSVAADHDAEAREEWAQTATWAVLEDKAVEERLDADFRIPDQGTPFYCVVDDQGRVVVTAVGVRHLEFLLRELFGG